MIRTVFRLSPLFAILFFCICLCGCSFRPPDNTSGLGSLAYSSRKTEAQYTVLLPEGDTMVPYLVLTNDYNGTGNCLLVRKHVLHDVSIFNPNVRYSGYYEDSVIDRFLNDDFVQTLSPQVAGLLANTAIDITAKESLWGGDEKIITISRRVFLLSAAEVGDPGSMTVPTEGEPLAYFNTKERRIACFENGTAVSWWLRTPNIWYDNVVCGVDAQGVIGIGGVGGYTNGGEYKSGVRPAFCIPATAEIEYINGSYCLRLSN